MIISLQISENGVNNMVTESKKRILIIEDDVDECQKFAKHIKTREDIELVGITNSSEEGISYLKNYQIDAVILDIELQYGEGSGIEFIENLNNEKLKHRPMIVIVSSNIGENTYSFLHSNKVDHIFYKGQKGYSQEKVVNLIMSLLPYSKNNNPKIIKIANEVINIEDEYEIKVSSKINKMLDDFRNFRKFSSKKVYFRGYSLFNM